MYPIRAVGDVGDIGITVISPGLKLPRLKRRDPGSGPGDRNPWEFLDDFNRITALRTLKGRRPRGLWLSLHCHFLLALAAHDLNPDANREVHIHALHLFNPIPGPLP